MIESVKNNCTVDYSNSTMQTVCLQVHMPKHPRALTVMHIQKTALQHKDRPHQNAAETVACLGEFKYAAVTIILCVLLVVVLAVYVLTYGIDPFVTAPVRTPPFGL